MYAVLGITQVIKQFKLRTDQYAPAKLFFDGKPNLQLTRSKKYLLRLLASGNCECALCGSSPTHFQYFSEDTINNIDSYKGWHLVGYDTKKEKQTFYNIDHIIPQSLGGIWSVSNTRLTCRGCNSIRGNIMTDTEMFTQLKISNEFEEISECLTKKYNVGRVVNWIHQCFMKGKSAIKKQLKALKQSLGSSNTLCGLILFPKLKEQLAKRFGMQLTNEMILLFPN
jgi:hypothetical protein